MKSACKALGVAVLLLLPAGSPRAEERELAQLSAPAVGRVTLQFQGMEVVEVLKILAEQAGFDLVAGKNVSGRVTLFLKEVDPWEALEVVLAANELAYEKRGEILTIMTQRDFELLHGQPYADRRVLRSVPLRAAKAADVSRALAQVKSNIGRVVADEVTNTLILMDTPDLVEKMLAISRQMDQPVETRIFSLNNAPVKAVGALLQDSLTKGMGRISVEERSNQLAVTDYPAKLNEIARIIRAFDERSSEVHIDAKIVQVTLSDKFQLGIDWQAFLSKQLQLKGATALNLTTGGILTFDALQGTKHGSSKLLVEALRTFGDTRILSEPRITVVNNQEAKILVGSKEPYVTTQISQSGTGTSITSETVNFIDVGVKLFVTPTISRDGFIQMKIRPEVSSKTSSLTTANKNEIPIVETAEVETVLLVEDGGTVVLGGLIKDEGSVDEQRIPVLGDIPVLGIPFRSQKKTIKKTELVVLLTPRIVEGRRGEAFSSTPQAQQTSRAEGVFVPAPVDRQAYSAQLTEAIQKVARVQSLLGAQPGTVRLNITLDPDGRLHEKPEVISSEDTVLIDLAQTAALAASPFPAFSPGMGPEPVSFDVTLSYE